MTFISGSCLNGQCVFMSFWTFIIKHFVIMFDILTVLVI